MEQLLDFITHWLRLFFDVVSAAAGNVISWFEWPAQMTGIPKELLAMGLLCVALLALWRAMGSIIS